MRIFKDKKSLISIAVGAFEFTCIYFSYYYFFHNNIFTTKSSITWGNISTWLLFDFLATLLVPTILIILNKKNLNLFRLSFTSYREIFVLSVVMVLLFFLHKDFTIKGFYLFFFYLVVVAFAEEFIYRGFVYNRLKGNSEALAIIISGILWGVTHAALPSVKYHMGIDQALGLMSNEIGFGIIIGCYFIYLLEKSETLWIPILMHAILDYTVGYIGIFIAIGIFFYFLWKSKNRKQFKWLTYPSYPSGGDRRVRNQKSRAVWCDSNLGGCQPSAL